MRARTSLWASMAIAASVGLAGCGGSNDNNEGSNPPDSTTPTPVDVTADIKLTTAQNAALLSVLPPAGRTSTLNNVGEGDSNDNPGAVRAGVLFTCVSAYPCTITLENSAGTIVATVHTQHLPGTTVSGAAAGLRPDAVDTFARLNDGSATRVRTLLAGSGMPTEILGMGIGGPGVLPPDAETAELRSSFQANGADAGGTAAGPGAEPTLTGGTKINVVVPRPDATPPVRGDRISPSSDMAAAPAGWTMRTLFRDWGDTAGDGDGGFETGAIVVTNLGGGTPHPFDRKLSGRFEVPAAKPMFALTTSASGATTLASLTTSVDINATTASELQRNAMEFDTTSLVPAQDQDIEINDGETFSGTYFGARGQFRCISGDCGLARKKKDGKVIENGPVVVTDAVPGTAGFQNGRWTFTPDPGAMVTVPDQDWMVYGAWLTTPDNGTGNHRFGVVFNGLDIYAFNATANLDATLDAGFRGSAEYKGGATGVYVDDDTSGLFTADATLTANFDKNSNATDDTGDYQISGRIDNFRGTDGIYLGSDTSYDPNDPDKGGENDWVVTLRNTDIVAAGVLDSTPGGSSGTTAGSADGNRWTGDWSGHFFGPSVDADGDAIVPSGVAGRFSARTSGTTPVGHTSVVGAFGATKQ